MRTGRSVGDSDIRLLDLDHVSSLHSQTIYHAVAYCTTETSSGTIVILGPREPYVSVGYHQLLEKEIDTEYCRKKGIPIIRREIGGGAVYLDREQLFFQCIFPRDKAPFRVDHLFKLFLRPAVDTYRRLGVNADFRPVNDIQVEERKICGTGAGRIGDASVVVGNIMFDFNYGEMARVLRVPSEQFREKACESMKIYVTTLQRELGHKPEVEKVKSILIAEFEKTLGISLRKGVLTEEEQLMLARIDSRFGDPEWLNEKGGKLNKWLKINSDVNMRESAHQSPGGLIRTILRRKGNRIDDILISGDFTFQPSASLRRLEDKLRGLPLEPDHLLGSIESYYHAHDIQSPGVTPEDMVRAIIGEKNVRKGD